MNDQELVDEVYDTILKSIFGTDGNAKSTLLGIPVKRDDTKAIIVIAYYLGQAKMREKYQPKSVVCPACNGEKTYGLCSLCKGKGVVGEKDFYSDRSSHS